MATQVACPQCGTLMREIVWGYGTIADVADAGDVVIGGCVIDVDAGGRAAALQCPACGTRTDAHGIALERPQPAPTTEHPFAVAFSSPPGTDEEVTMSEQASQGEEQPPGGHEADASPYVDDDFGGVASGGDWRDHVEPYASRDDALPTASAPAPERVEPYASRDDALPARAASSPERVPPYASREDALPPSSAPAPDHVDPYASREDALPDAADRAWRDRIAPFADS
ncbi:hypothetical protein [Agrococcus carbonis]|uniref:Uncharacterized protein n=1 Tax=Agrococcus carbonis TaxID=684552 RepID=A0A1H1P352_9MICO|nr:hypothetical protein [Agrococcus carbonis]SDS05696.1 hypothetical protein SAMN04489719_1438 [Agrococcus carbonis]